MKISQYFEKEGQLSVAICNALDEKSRALPPRTHIRKAFVETAGFDRFKKLYYALQMHGNGNWFLHVDNIYNEDWYLRKIMGDGYMRLLGISNLDPYVSGAAYLAGGHRRIMYVDKIPNDTVLRILNELLSKI